VVLIQRLSWPRSNKKRAGYLATFIEVARVEDVPSGTATVVTAGETQLALISADGTLYAIHNRCTHRAGISAAIG
jgi:nitrite reductase/ring-hydroxylating ferredoxin subunit